MLDASSEKLPDCFGAFSEKDIQCHNCVFVEGCKEIAENTLKKIGEDF